MRNLALLFVLAMPSLVCAGVAHAAASADVTKPVCTHYDDTSSKAADARATQAASGASATGTVTGSAPSPVTMAPASTIKSGGSPTELRPHNAPRWQAFLPGMFR